MPKKKIATMYSKEVLSTLEDTIKGLMLRPGTKCEIRFDIGFMQSECRAQGLAVTLEFIKGLIKSYCESMRSKTSRIVDLEFEDISPRVFQVAFTVRIFDKDALPVIDQKFADKVAVSNGDWVTARAKEKQF